MTAISDLPNLEQTVIELVIELLALDEEQRFSTLIFGSPRDKASVRITTHYVLALLAYGLFKDEKELQSAADWFEHNFPRSKSDRVDGFEMNQLDVLLHLRPRSERIVPRLEQLRRQYIPHRGYFDVQPNWPAFDTLWTLEIFTQAKQSKVLAESVVSTDDMELWLDRLISSDDLKRDKDIALALRLQYEIFGTLPKAHEDILNELIETFENNGGVWGMRDFEWQMEQMSWLESYRQGTPITYANIERYQEGFRRIVLSTCMVIENLVPLTKDYPQIKDPIKRAMTIWWQQFHERNAVTVLRQFFPREQDYYYLLVLSRTIRAVRQYVGKPLRELDTLPLFRKLTDLKIQSKEADETHNIIEALREWLHIDLRSSPKQLKLGFSEAQVVRVEPYVGSPLMPAATSWINNSLVIKYGRKEDIELERRNYNTLPTAVQDNFVQIPRESYVDENTGLAYVIMEDLHDYVTMYEVREKVSQYVHEISDQLIYFLFNMHEGGRSQPRTAPRSFIRDVYLGRMLEHVDRIFNFVLDHELVTALTEIDELQNNLFERIGEIIRNQHTLQEFPVAYMHGDLHLRNIMIKDIEDLSQPHNRGVKFKLIDLENLRRDGDAAFDAGQLLVDIERIYEDELSNSFQSELWRLQNALDNAYHKFGEQRNDPHFSVRTHLAKARALLRIAKGKTKRGIGFVDSNQTADAERIAREVVEHAEQSLSYLNAVVGGLKP